MNQPTTIAVDRAGRVVLPVQLRRRLNLHPGSCLLLEVVAQKIELTPEPQQTAELVMSAGRRTVLRPSGKEPLLLRPPWR